VHPYGRGVCRSISVDTGDRHQKDRALTGLGRIYHLFDDPSRTRVRYRDALALHANLDLAGGRPDLAVHRGASGLICPPR
jgi:hypothetical protein